MEYVPNKWAYDHVHTRDERFITLVTCRQSGKTEAASAQIFNEMSEPPSLVGNKLVPPEVGVISFDFPHAMKSVERFLQKMAHAFPGKYKQNVNEHKVWFPDTGATLYALSTDNPHSLAGFTFSSVIVDEGQFVPDEAMAILRPTLSVREARMFSFGTPQITPYQSWFRANYMRGLDEAPEYDEYHSFTVSSELNRWISPQDLKLAKESETERNFRMLYLGEWVDDEGSVFTGVDDCVRGEPQTAPSPGRSYYMSVDFAATDDYNVILIADRATRHVVYMERFNKRGTVYVANRVEELYDKWGQPPVWTDESNGLGIAMGEEIRKRGMRVRPVKFNSANKMQMIQRLASDIEHHRITYADLPQLIRELKGYQYEQTRSGKLTANAPAGYHDDCVSSLILINEGLRRGSSSGSAPHSYLESKSHKMKKLLYA